MSIFAFVSPQVRRTLAAQQLARYNAEQDRRAAAFVANMNAIGKQADQVVADIKAAEDADARRFAEAALENMMVPGGSRPCSPPAYRPMTGSIRMSAAVVDDDVDEGLSGAVVQEAFFNSLDADHWARDLLGNGDRTTAAGAPGIRRHRA